MRFTDLTPEAIEQVLQEWAPASPRAGIVALLPEAEKDRIPLLQAAAERHSMALAGAVFQNGQMVTKTRPGIAINNICIGGASAAQQPKRSRAHRACGVQQSTTDPAKTPGAGGKKASTAGAGISTN